MQRGIIKRIAIFCAVIASAAVFAAAMSGCGNTADRCKIAPEMPVYKADARITALDGYKSGSEYGDAAFVYKADTDGRKEGLYNFRLNKFVMDPTADVQSTVVNHGVFGVRSDSAEITLYSQTEKIVTLKDGETDNVVSNDIVDVGCDYTAVTTPDKTYFIDGDGNVKTVTNGPKSFASSLDYVTDKYLLDVNLSGSVGAYVKVYDAATFEFVRYIDLAPYVYGNVYSPLRCVLGDGNIAVQYAEETSAYTDDYDYAAGDSKYRLHTYVINVGNGRVSAKNVDFLIADVENKYCDSFMTDYDDYYAAENIAQVTKIKDKSLTSIKTWIAMTSGLGIDYDFGEIYGGGYLPIRVADDKYVWINGSGAGSTVVTNGAGEVLADGVSFNWNYRLLVKGDKKAYDFDFNAVASGSVNAVYGKYALCQKEDGYYVNSRNVGTISGSNSMTTFSSYGVYETMSGDKYALYYADGKELAVSDSQFSLMTGSDSYAVFVSADAKGAPFYFRIKANDI